MAFSGMKMWRQAVDQIRLMIEALEVFEKRLGGIWRSDRRGANPRGRRYLFWRLGP
jgi:hypothetical protein